MNRIVRDHYPIEKLPSDLREGLDPADHVRISIEVEKPPHRKLGDILDEIEAAQSRGDLTAATDDPVERIRKLRDEWDS
jgi:hypothetical protein